MLALSSSWTEFLVLAAAGVVGAIILGMGKAVMGLVKSRQSKARSDESDQLNLGRFFFDQPRDTRTGTPPTVGWTTRVDAALESLARSQESLTRAQDRTAKTVNEILYEVKQNGGGNLRGAIDRVADAHDRNESEGNGGTANA